VGNQALFVSGPSGVMAHDIINTLQKSSELFLTTSTSHNPDSLMSTMSSKIVNVDGRAANALSRLNRKTPNDIILLMAQNFVFDNYAFLSTATTGQSIDDAIPDIKTNVGIIFDYCVSKCDRSQHFPETKPLYTKFLTFKTHVENAKRGIVCSWPQWRSYGEGCVKRGMWVHHFFLFQNLFHQFQVQSLDDLVNESECSPAILEAAHKQNKFVFYGGDWQDFFDIDQVNFWRPVITWKGSRTSADAPLNDPNVAADLGEVPIPASADA